MPRTFQHSTGGRTYITRTYTLHDDGTMTAVFNDIYEKDMESEEGVLELIDGEWVEAFPYDEDSEELYAPGEEEITDKMWGARKAQLVHED